MMSKGGDLTLLFGTKTSRFQLNSFLNNDAEYHVPHETTYQGFNAITKT